MTKFATIDLHSGYIWWSGYAADAHAACEHSDATSMVSGRSFDLVHKSDADHGYAVYAIPDDLEITDGQSREQIAAVEDCRLVGFFKPLKS